MGTRSLVRVYDEEDREIFCLYRQFDGYPSGMGKDLAEACKVRLVNGMTDHEPDQANGMGCLAARIVAMLKVQWEDKSYVKAKAPCIQPGNVYLHAPGLEDCGEEFEYHVRCVLDKKNASDPVDLRRSPGKIVLSCYVVYHPDFDIEKGELGKRELFPLAEKVAPAKLVALAEKGQKKYSVHRAALDMDKKFKGEPWYCSTAIANDALVVLCHKKPPLRKVPKTCEWDEEIKVKTRVIGKAKPSRKKRK